METDKGVIGANLRAAQPTTDPQDLARSEMMRLICREADKSFFHFRGNYIGHLKEDETVEYYRQPPSDTLRALDSTPDGLTPEQAAARLARDGRNVLTEPPKPSLVKRFFQQLADPMILVLLAAALISAVTSAYAHESFADVIIILIVVIINAVLGVYQESKAEQAIAALKELSAAHSRVLRGGKLVTVPSRRRGGATRSPRAACRRGTSPSWSSASRRAGRAPCAGRGATACSSGSPRTGRTRTAWA